MVAGEEGFGARSEPEPLPGPPGRAVPCQVSQPKQSSLAEIWLSPLLAKAANFLDLSFKVIPSLAHSPFLLAPLQVLTACPVGPTPGPTPGLPFPNLWCLTSCVCVCVGEPTHTHTPSLREKPTKCHLLQEAFPGAQWLCLEVPAACSPCCSAAFISLLCALALSLSSIRSSLWTWDPSGPAARGLPLGPGSCPSTPFRLGAEGLLLN